MKLETANVFHIVSIICNNLELGCCLIVIEFELFILYTFGLDSSLLVSTELDRVCHAYIHFATKVIMIRLMKS